jgi:hypothetical protein
MTKLTLPRFGSRAPGRGFCEITRLFLTLLEYALLIVPTVQWALVSAARDAGRVLPFTFGTLQGGGGGGGGGSGGDAVVVALQVSVSVSQRGPQFHGHWKRRDAPSRELRGLLESFLSVRLAHDADKLSTGERER